MMQTNPRPMPHGTRSGWTIAAASLPVVLLAALAFKYAFSHLNAATGKERQTWAGLLTIVSIVGCFGVAGLISGLVYVYARRGERRVIDELHAGKNVLAHWTYTPDEWSHYVEHERARAGRRCRTVILVAAVPVVALLAFNLSGLSRSDGLRYSLVLVLFALFPVVLLVVVLWLVLYLPVMSLRRMGRGDAYISRDGVLLHNRYYNWSSWYTTLSSVTFEEGAAGNPSIVQFTWAQPGVPQYHASKVNDARIPVPRGREAEARALVATFNARG